MIYIEWERNWMYKKHGPVNTKWKEAITELVPFVLFFGIFVLFLLFDDGTTITNLNSFIIFFSL